MEVNKIYKGKMEIVLPDFPESFAHSVVTDPPYGLRFMGKKWDYNVPTVEQWLEAYRVLKPGGHLLCACGTRTQHRMTVNIEDAGFEIRDVITWHYGSGFPKSFDVSKGIDKHLGVDRIITGTKSVIPGVAFEQSTPYAGGRTEINTTASATAEGKEFEGYGTALKPATEFWTLARKPLSESTVAENVLKHGTGGLNIDGCRIETDEVKNNTTEYSDKGFWGSAKENNGAERWVGDGTNNPNGRFPANVIFDEFMADELDKQSGILTSGHMESVSKGTNYGIYGQFNGHPVYAEGDSGGASRFFYCAKADNFQRNKGLKNFDTSSQNVEHRYGRYRCLKCSKLKLDYNPCKCENPDFVRIETNRGNNHPTV